MTQILVAEDEPDIRELLVDLLNDAGYDVIVASDGGAALEKARLELPDMVILDLMLPVLDGFQVLEALKSDPATRSMPVIVVSAREREADQTRARNCGASDYIIKPWQPGEIETKVKAAESAIP